MAPSHEILARLARISVGVAACLRTRTPVSVWVWALLDPDRNSVLTNSGGQLWQDHPSKESYRWDRSGGTVLPSAGQEPALTVFFLAQDGLASISPHTLEGLFTEARDQFAQSNQGPLRLFAGARDV
jgi:hypothetical protein